jgi:hypothetical protein
MQRPGQPPGIESWRWFGQWRQGRISFLAFSEVFADRLDLLAIFPLVRFCQSESFPFRVTFVARMKTLASDVNEPEIVPFIFRVRRGVGFESEAKCEFVWDLLYNVTDIGRIDAVEYLVECTQKGVNALVVSVDGTLQLSLA